MNPTALPSRAVCNSSSLRKTLPVPAPARRRLAALMPLIAAQAAAAQTTQLPDFTYQGHLDRNGHAATGNVDLHFTLFDAAVGGNQIGAAIDEPAYPISAGLFTVDLSFPGAFAGDQRWLEVSVNGKILKPRQAVSAGPVAQFALTGSPGPQGAQGATGAPGPQGTTGATGSQGAQGAQGPQGAQGAAGDQGPTGAVGPTGAQGQPGDAGATGPQGLAGATGATGDPGSPGIAGPVGPPASGYNLLQIAQLRWYGAANTGSLPVGNTPTAMTFDGTSIWVANSGANTVVKLRASDGKPLVTIDAGNHPHSLAFDGFNIWVANDDSVMKLRASDGANVGTFFANLGFSFGDIVFDGDIIWVGHEPIGAYGLNPTDGSLIDSSYSGPQPRGMAFDGTYLWMATSTGNRVAQIYTAYPPGYSYLLADYPVGTAPVGVAFDGTNIWVTNSGDNTVSELRTSDGANLGTFPVGNNPQGIVFDGVNLWVVNQGDNNVSKLRPSDGTVVGVFAVGASPQGIVFDGANVWVSNSGDNSLSKL